MKAPGRTSQPLPTRSAPVAVNRPQLSTSAIRALSACALALFGQTSVEELAR